MSMNEYEIYQEIDRLLPKRVHRDAASTLYRGGEPESAIADLLDEAYGKGCLTDEIISLVRSEFEGGPANEVLDGLEMLNARKSAD